MVSESTIQFLKDLKTNNNREWFLDNKKRLSYTIFSGSPGIMRVKMHEFISTQGFTVDDKKAIRDKAWDVIHKELVASEKAK